MIETMIAQGIAEPATQAGVLGLCYAIVRLIEGAISKRSVNGYAKAEALASHVDQASRNHGELRELIAMMLERQQAANGYAHDQAQTLRQIAQLLAERRDLTDINKLFGDMRTEIHHMQKARD